MNLCNRDIRVQGRVIRVASPELDKYEPLVNPQALINELKTSSARIDLLTFMELTAETSPKYSYAMEWDNLAVLTVSTFDHWWNHQICSYPRNRARQAEKKGVTLREVPFSELLVQGMWKVYNETPVRQGKRNVHFGKNIDRVREEEATFLDRSIFVGAFLSDTLIGFAKLVTDRAQTRANLMNIVSMVRQRDKAPSNALIAQAVRSCAERGIRHLAYQSYTYGSKKEDSLTHFKRVNGFQRIDLPRYYVPLTALGDVALRFGLHRRLVDRLPEPLLAKLREFRSAWYNRKLESILEAA